ncbi:MAG: hypothetical protein AAF352_02185 [Pseudomonadota bacterium]
MGISITGSGAIFGVLAAIIVIIDAVLLERPLLVVDADRRYIAVQSKTHADHYIITGRRNDHFVARLWQDAFAITTLVPIKKAAKQNADVLCDDDGCVVAARSNVIVALPNTLEAMRQDCKRADIVIFPEWGVPDGWCEDSDEEIKLIDRWDIADHGTIAIIKNSAEGFSLIGGHNSNTPWAVTYGRSQ